VGLYFSFADINKGVFIFHKKCKNIIETYSLLQCDLSLTDAEESRYESYQKHSAILGDIAPEKNVCFAMSVSLADVKGTAGDIKCITQSRPGTSYHHITII